MKAKIILSLVVALAFLYVALFAARVFVRKYYIFLPDYVRWSWNERPSAAQGSPTHVFFLFVDHFEPRGDTAFVRRWVERYAALADRHRDSAGRPVQHTWFYPGEQYHAENLGVLREAVARGLGEVELHLHHGNDTEQSLRDELSRSIAQFQAFGYLKTTGGETAWAFIHGNNALDNSTQPSRCGVSTELRLLRELGGFADFTFPALYTTGQPSVVNRIFMARDDPGPKSYARALPLDAPGDLTIFQGPIVLAPTWSLRRLFVEVDDGNIHAAIPASPRRVDRWVSARISVPSRPDWVFVKVFGHSAQSAGDADAALGPTMDATLSHLERRYNDGRRYVLHYVTAREAYNLAYAASRGARGDPRAHLDARIPAYAAGARATEKGTLTVLPMESGGKR